MRVTLSAATVNKPVKRDNCHWLDRRPCVPSKLQSLQETRCRQCSSRVYTQRMDVRLWNFFEFQRPKLPTYVHVLSIANNDIKRVQVFCVYTNIFRNKRRKICFGIRNSSGKIPYIWNEKHYRKPETRPLNDEQRLGEVPWPVCRTHAAELQTILDISYALPKFVTHVAYICLIVTRGVDWGSGDHAPSRWLSDFFHQKNWLFGR